MTLEMPNPNPVRVNRQIAFWLFCLCGFIALVVLVGGMTRLTDSGLSITEWKPVTGVLPPLNAQDWQQEFLKYQAIPEYRLMNDGMSLPQFKMLYWWEWGHRLLARMAGVIFLVPFIWFWVKHKLPPGSLREFFLLLALGAAQGALGWYMVKSGLTNRVDVSQYRLAAHLGLAFLVYGYALWLGLSYWRDQQDREDYPKALAFLSMALCGAIFIQVLLGALMAGLDAGLTYNEWPRMDGYWAPPGLLRLQPAHLNIFENITLVQFNHRWWGAVVLVLGAALYWRGRAVDGVRSGAGVVLAILVAQFALGIWTLLTVAPMALSAAHQMGGLLSFTAALAVAHRLNGRRR